MSDFGAADTRRYVVLTGGVGGAKLVHGLNAVLPAGALTAVINTGDDFEHLGLNIWPDFDTTLYTLAGLADREKGWGRADETWTCLSTLAELGAESWFRIGDRDLAVHILRTRMLREGRAPSEVASRLQTAFGVPVRLLPATEDPVHTRLTTAEGILDFQEYFVRRRCEPPVEHIDYEGAAGARPASGCLEALSDRRLAGILLAPSNPLLSMGPVLAVRSLTKALEDASVPVIAVSPIVAGAAIKGPAAKIMTELGMECSATAVARFYRNILDGFILDTADAGRAGDVEALGMRCRVAETVMTDDAGRARLAREALEFLGTLSRVRGSALP